MTVLNNLVSKNLQVTPVTFIKYELTNAQFGSFSFVFAVSLLQHPLSAVTLRFLF